MTGNGTIFRHAPAIAANLAARKYIAKLDKRVSENTLGLFSEISATTKSYQRKFWEFYSRFNSTNMKFVKLFVWQITQSFLIALQAVVDLKENFIKLSKPN